MPPRGDRLRKRLIDGVPLPCLTNAHELSLAVALAFIGLWIILGNLSPSSVQEQAPQWMEYGWAAFLFTGSTLTIVGLFAARPRMEWAGQCLLGWGCAFYAVAVGLNSPLDAGGVIVIVFIVLACASWWRAFKITSTAYVQHRLAREARCMARGTKA